MRAKERWLNWKEGSGTPKAHTFSDCLVHISRPACLPQTSLRMPVSVSARLPGLQWAHGPNPETAEGPSRRASKEQKVREGCIRAGGGLSLMVLVQLTLSAAFFRSVIFISKAQIILLLFLKKSESVAHQGPNFHSTTIHWRCVGVL